MGVFFKKLCFAVVLFVAGTLHLNAQTRAYYVYCDYDHAGNRISRFAVSGPDRQESIVIDTISGIVISIYNNPTTNIVTVNTINGNNESALSATLLSPFGAPLERKTLDTTSVVFELDDMEIGVYIIEISDGTETKTWRIIKRQ